MNPSTALVNRIWRLCTLLRKDGVTYQQYVNEITYLIFLKMMKERNLEHMMPPSCRWQRLLEEKNPLEAYRSILQRLRAASEDNSGISVVFSGASTIVRDEKNLRSLISAIDELPWYDNGRDNFGDIYEGILEKNAEESKRGAGQYFTPRVIVEAIVQAIRPEAGELVQDPAAGTGGFLIRADEYVRRQSGSNRASGRLKFAAMENVPDTYRLLLMNLNLHEIDTATVFLGDTLSDDHQRLPRADIILSNPPFGSAGGRPTRGDLEFTSSVSNYQLPFVEHCLRALNERGRAAIVVPDNVLFEDGRARELRRYMIDEYDLHTVLRLPGGIFYAAGVKTNVLFINKAKRQKSRFTWVYDLRTNMPTFNKTSPLSEAALDEFLEFYGAKSDGSQRPTVSDSSARFRAFSREDLRSRDDDLDITWLKDATDPATPTFSDPRHIVRAISEHLSAATQALSEIERSLEGTHSETFDD